MATFSYQHHPSLLDSVFFPNSTTLPSNMSAFFKEPNNTTVTCFSQFYQPAASDPLQEASVEVSVHESDSCCLEHNNSTTKVNSLSNNCEPKSSVTNNKHATDSSSVVLEISTGEQVTQRVTPMDKKRKQSLNSSAQSKDTREVKGKKLQKKIVEEKKTRAADEEAPTGYIHVRARRGQATDSHSLAERVRREKISERMKLLQALVPGCDKVTGKALMLDEIINYVQSLQNQVEFLSMKLASVNPMFYDFGMDLHAFMVKPERMSSLEAPLQPSVQQYSPNQSTTFSNTTNTTFTAANNVYTLVDSSTLPLLQQGQMPNILSHQSNGQLLWDMDEQRQKNISQSGFSNNLCSFH